MYETRIKSNCFVFLFCNSFKTQLLEYLHHLTHLKKSPSFFYDIVCCLTKSNYHDQYNLDAHLVPFCSKEQILNLLSQWSISNLEKIDSNSLFYSKLIHYQPHIVIHLIRCSLHEKKINHQQFSSYLQNKDRTLLLIAKNEPKAICRLAIEYVHQLEQHERLLPYFIQSKQKYFFKKAPDEMIELITLIASHQPGLLFVYVEDAKL